MKKPSELFEGKDSSLRLSYEASASFAERIKDNPKKIIAFCKREIKEYQKLINLLEKKK